MAGLLAGAIQVLRLSHGALQQRLQCLKIVPLAHAANETCLYPSQACHCILSTLHIQMKSHSLTVNDSDIFPPMYGHQMTSSS